MSQRDNDSIEVARWKKKFLDALEVHDSREKSLLNRIRLLRRGLVGVSLAGDGLDSSLDRELASLRTTLRSEDSESGLELLLERIERSVLRLDSRKEQSISAIENALNLSVKQLLEVNLSRELKRGVKQYAKILPAKIKDPQNHAQLLVDFLELIRMVVRELTFQPETEVSQNQSGFWSRLFSGSTEKADNPPAATPAPAPTPTSTSVESTALHVDAEDSHDSSSITNTSSPEKEATSQPVKKDARIVNASASGISSSTKQGDVVAHESTGATEEPTPENDSAQEALNAVASDEDRDTASAGTQTDASAQVQVAEVDEGLAQAPAEDAIDENATAQEAEPGFSAIANHAEPALLRILDNIFVTEQSVPLASKIRGKIARGLNWYEFVSVLEDIYALITAALEQERTEFQRFLNELNESLGQVQEYVQFSRAQEGEARESERRLDDEVRNQISDIAETVQVAEDIDELKHAVQGQLSTILSSMDQFKAMKAEQQEHANEHTKQLEERLRAMELESKELRVHLAQQEQMASRDALTELPNRAAYDKRMQTEFAQWRNRLAQGTDGGLCLAICDVDHFKRINDTYGHLAGDKVLKILAKEISSRLRKSDFVARYGGEEFVIIMPSTRIEDAEPLVNGIRQKIEKCPFHFKEKQVQITMSFGLAAFGEPDTPERVFERGDKALYRAKEGGRNQVCVAKPATTTQKQAPTQ